MVKKTKKSLAFQTMRLMRMSSRVIWMNGAMKTKIKPRRRKAGRVPKTQESSTNR